MSKEDSKFLSPLELLVKKQMPILERADIILIRNKKGLMRRLLRKVTNSYWDHVALVIFPKDPKLGNQHNLIIEASDPNGIEIHKLGKYLNSPKKYDLGVVRFINLPKIVKDKAIAFMLMNVDAPYYRLKLRRFVFALVNKKYSEKLMGRQRFCCSGFVQKSFFDAVSWENRKYVVFRSDFLSPIELQEMTTPGDIAYSKKVKWIFNKHV